MHPPKDTHLQILSVIRRIPQGRVLTYGRVAAQAGLPGRSRLVGQVLKSSPLAGEVPWHRVVNAGGGISARDGGSDRQRRLLLAEGVRFSASGKIDLGKYLWRSQ